MRNSGPLSKEHIGVKFIIGLGLFMIVPAILLMLIFFITLFSCVYKDITHFCPDKDWFSPQIFCIIWIVSWFISFREMLNH